MTDNGTTKNELVNATCLGGLEILKDHKLVFLATPTYDIFADHGFGNGELVVEQNHTNNSEESKETIISSTQLVSSWSDKIRFDDEGYVVSLDLGGRRLYKGLPFEPAVFGTDSFPRLTALNLAGTDLPLTDILAIVSHIESTIECLYLGGNALGSRGAGAIAASGLFRSETTTTASKLVKLDLRYNDIGGAGMEAISNALMNTTNASTNNSVQYLYLEGNNIGDEGCAALSELLSSKSQTVQVTSSSGIQEVYLGANAIGPAGAECIASVLRVNKTISKIYLEGNTLGAQGATSFCNVLEELKGDTGLKHLYVDNNNIGKELSNRLAKALRSDTAIEDISS
jgi:Ran GTPase-activating protein (RanGAP) involved in mRNA processing and transport